MVFFFYSPVGCFLWRFSTRPSPSATISRPPFVQCCKYTLASLR